MAYPGKPKYALLNSSDADADLDSIPATAPPVRPMMLSSSLVSLSIQAATLITSLAVLSLVLISPRNPFSSPAPSPAPAPSALLPVGMSRVNPSTAHQLQPCGTDATTARANGCIFDLLTLAWLAPACYDADLSEEFLEVASEPFYYDSDAQQPIENYEILSERPVGETSWTTRKYHIYHCSYGWRLMHRALERGGIVESGLSSYHHTEHCTDTLMNTSVPMESVITRAEISFPDC
ncbi:hypothetical protein L228DRAFT_247592 [Xylona heveae TC161]|uniref:Uncharacterized protein n=1 Tax=Xylona heveae (strain CBS 132557 / TC161) TaxID=1328760 RepID=A0A165GBB1_XYLHT|nr:hypothetical protein L228DRAFT_247592 [Xylona heveae TC161]KZF21982.1 hypothetical protein L228DRAFT_247592 [Xylona heveae TC161]